MDFQQAVNYGMRHLNAKVQRKELAQAAKTDTTPVDPVDCLEHRETFDCVWCTRTHSKGECTVLCKFCAECGIKGHTPGSKFCKSRRSSPMDDKQSNCSSRRYSGRSEDSRRDRNPARSGDLGGYRNSARKDSGED